jgi:hypothetical protein
MPFGSAVPPAAILELNIGKNGVSEFFGKLRSAAAFEPFEVTYVNAKEDRLSSPARSASRATLSVKPPTTPGRCTGPFGEGLVVSMTSYEDTAALAEAFGPD